MGSTGARPREEPMKKYKVTLTPEERQSPSALIASGKAPPRKPPPPRALLHAAPGPGGPAWTDERIAAAVSVGRATVERVRQRFVEQGLEAALGRKPQDRP